MLIIAGLAFLVLLFFYLRRVRGVQQKHARKTLRTYNEMTRWTLQEQENLRAHLVDGDPLRDVARLEYESNNRALFEQDLERSKLARILGIPLEEARNF